MSRITLVGWVLWGAVALAQEPLPELAPQPLEILRTAADCTPKDREDLKKLLPMMLRAADVAVPDSAKLSAALATVRREECGSEDACLARLAQLAGSLYAFEAQVDFESTGEVLASGRVVRDDGRVVSEPMKIKVPRAADTACRASAQGALMQLLAELGVAHLPPVRPREPVAEVRAAPHDEPALLPHPPPLPTTVVSQAPSAPWRVPGVVGAGTGVVCLVVGGVLYGTAGEVRTNVSQGVVRVFSDDAARVANLRGAQTGGVALLAVGAVLVAAGAGLVLWGPKGLATTVAPLNGGAAVLLQGTLP